METQPTGLEGEPTGEHELVARSDDLDDRIARSDIIAQLKASAINNRATSRLALTVAVVEVIALVVLAVGLVKVSRNSDQIRETKRVIHTICEERNKDNSRIRFVLPTLFPDSNPDAMKHLGDALWPNDDCDAQQDGTVPSTEVP